MTKIDTSTEAVEALLKDVTPGPWLYRPEKFDDWGYVRAANQGKGWKPFLLQAKGITTEKDEESARRKGIDPWGANAKFIAASRELIPALLAERDQLRDELNAAYAIIVDQRGEINKLREALSKKDQANDN